MTYTPARRAYKVATNSGRAPTRPLRPQKRDFTTTAPGTGLVGDITFVRAWTRWLYLVATLIDCHTKAVLGWSVADEVRTDLICHAVTMLASLALAPGVVTHADRERSKRAPILLPI